MKREQATRRIVFRVEAETGAVSVLRRRTRDRLEEHGVGERTLDTLVLVLDELVNNAIDHGGDYRRPSDRLEVALSVEAGAIELSFVDPSAPATVVDELRRQFSSTEAMLPALDLERGRGLFLISTMLEDLEIRAATAGGLEIAGHVPRG